MTFKDWLEALPKVKYSELSEYKKMAAAINGCLALYEDMQDGQFPFRKNDKWYGTLLRLISDLGYDVEPIREIDWYDFSKNADFCYHVALDLEHKISDEGQAGFLTTSIVIEQIIMDE